MPPVWTGHSAAKDWLLTTYEELRAKHDDDLGKLQRAYQAAIRAYVKALKEAAGPARRARTVTAVSSDTDNNE